MWGTTSPRLHVAFIVRPHKGPMNRADRVAFATVAYVDVDTFGIAGRDNCWHVSFGSFEHAGTCSTLEEAKVYVEGIYALER